MPFLYGVIVTDMNFVPKFSGQWKPKCKATWTNERGEDLSSKGHAFKDVNQCYGLTYPSTLSSSSLQHIRATSPALVRTSAADFMQTKYKVTLSWRKQANLPSCRYKWFLNHLPCPCARTEGKIEVYLWISFKINLLKWLYIETAYLIGYVLWK
jgi:hypothetical protein